MDFETCARVTRDPFSHPIRVVSPPFTGRLMTGGEQNIVQFKLLITHDLHDNYPPFFENPTCKPPPVSFEMARDRVTWPTEMQNGRWNASMEGVTLHDVTGRTGQLSFLFLSLSTSDNRSFDLRVSRSLICINREIEKKLISWFSSTLMINVRSNDSSDFQFWRLWTFSWSWTTNRLAHLHTDVKADSHKRCFAAERTLEKQSSPALCLSHSNSAANPHHKQETE